MSNQVQLPKLCIPVKSLLSNPLVHEWDQQADSVSVGIRPVISDNHRAAVAFHVLLVCPLHSQTLLDLRGNTLPLLLHHHQMANVVSLHVEDWWLALQGQGMSLLASALTTSSHTPLAACQSMHSMLAGISESCTLLLINTLIFDYDFDLLLLQPCRPNCAAGIRLSACDHPEKSLPAVGIDFVLVSKQLIVSTGFDSHRGCSSGGGRGC